MLAYAMTLAAAGVALAQEPASGGAVAAPVVITLDDALRMAEQTSEQVAIAAAGLARADSGRQLARSERLPQLNGSASYDRALKSEFEGLFDATDTTPCPPLRVNPAALLADRVAELERAYECQPAAGFFGDGDAPDLPFGRANTYRLGLGFSQLLYAGGRVAAQERQASFRRDTARLGLSAARAQALLDAAEAFYDAAFAERLVKIAEETYAQADRSFSQASVQREAGVVSEFELLRAKVARDTLQPDVVRSRAARTVAHLRLKQLIELPLAAPVALAADLEDQRLPPPPRFAPRLVEAELAVPEAERVAIAQAAAELQAAQAGVDIARAQRRPSLSLRSDYGLVAYPSTAPAFDDWRTNWTVGALVSVPILNGGRLRADEATARAGVEEADARLKLTRELAALDAESARQELIAARAEWEASGATIEEALRAYWIAELRYREGLSTQLELSDARLLLAQSQVTRARAARDLQVRRIRYALLPELPLGGSSGPAVAPPAPAPAAPPATMPQQQRVQTSSAGATGGGGQ